MFVAGDSGGPSPAEGLNGRSIRHISCVRGVYLAGADDGIYASRDGGRSWKRQGAAGLMVWDIAPAPGDPRTLYAVTQPAALFRSTDGGETWAEVPAFLRAPDAARWCSTVATHPACASASRSAAWPPATTAARAGR
jgi:photosystem II stability/assembly factor-like uncharacterized protein